MEFEGLLAMESLPEPEHLPSMCRYTSKRCFSERAVKRDGKRHNLCEFHRLKANNNQRRLELRRRVRAIRKATRDSDSVVIAPATVRRRAAPEYNAQPPKTTNERPASCHHVPTTYNWRSAASMTIEDMARILAEDNDGLCQDLDTTPRLLPLLDADAAMSCASSCTSDGDDAASSVGSDDGNRAPSVSPVQLDSHWSVGHALGYDESQSASWIVDQTPGLAAFVNVHAPVDALFDAPWGVGGFNESAVDWVDWPNDSVPPLAAPLCSL